MNCKYKREEVSARAAGDPLFLGQKNYITLTILMTRNLAYWTEGLKKSTVPHSGNMDGSVAQPSHPHPCVCQCFRVKMQPAPLMEAFEVSRMTAQPKCRMRRFDTLMWL